MKSTKLLTSLMLSATILGTATPVVMAADTASSSSSTPATEISTSKNGSSQNEVKTEESSSSESESTKADQIQTLTEQTMIIRKIVAKDWKLSASVTPATGRDNRVAPGTSQKDFKGINGATFKVYDVTDLMNKLIKEKLGAKEGATDKEADEAIEKATPAQATPTNSESGTSAKTSAEKVSSDAVSNKDTDQAKDATSKSETSSAKATSKASESQTDSSKTTSEASGSQSESSAENDKEAELIKKVEEMRKSDTLKKEIADRAGKLGDQQQKEFASVKTEHDKDLDADGVARVKVPIDGKYHAYYVVNTDTPKETHAKNSDPVVVITPMTDENGEYAPDFTIYPKSDMDKVSQTKMVQTGRESFWDRLVSWFGDLF